MLNNGATYLNNAGEGDVPLWTGTYAATVVNNDDPLGVGRLQLNIPQVLANSVSAWAVPLGTYFSVPNNGTTVSATFIGGDPAQPSWIGPLDLDPVVLAATNRTTYSPSAPPSPNVGDIWYETFLDSVGNTISSAAQVWTFDSVHSTFSWVVKTATNTDNGVNTGSAVISARTIIGQAIKAGTIDGVNVTATFHGLNMIPDPQFGNTLVNAVRTSDPATTGSWTFSAAAAHVTASASIARLPLMPSTSTAMWLNPGETYYLSVTATTSASTQVGITIACNNGSNLSVQSTGTFTGQTFTGTVTIPAGVTSGYVRLFAFAASGTPTVTLSNPVCQPATLFSPTITGINWIANATGTFLYSGTPAAGNLVVADTPGSSGATDPFGNVTPGPGVWNYYSGGGTQYCFGLGSGGIGSYSAATQAGPWTPVEGITWDATTITVSGLGGLTMNNGPFVMSATSPGVILTARSTPAASAGNAVVFGNSNGQQIVLDGSDLITYNTQRRTTSLASASGSISSSTPASVGLSQAVTARTYRIHGQLYITTTSTPEFGLFLSVPSSSTTGQIGFSIYRGTTWVGAVNQNPSTNAAVAVPLSAGVTYIITIDGMFTPNASGTMNLEVFNNTGGTGSYTVNAFSFIDVMPV